VVARSRRKRGRGSGGEAAVVDVDLVPNVQWGVGALRAEQVVPHAGDLLGGLARALPSITVDYTDEAVRAMTNAQQRVIDRTKQDASTQFE
jgi:hypothetical protein